MPGSGQVLSAGEAPLTPSAIAAVQAACDDATQILRGLRFGAWAQPRPTAELGAFLVSELWLVEASGADFVGEEGSRRHDVTFSLTGVG